ncbi:MAG: hypothetical protein DMF59_12910 [Acidobacteria bacterium]|nr:MAG: hypothetical protein DMF59_12910 [Acidobacteriota bacterium]
MITHLWISTVILLLAMLAARFLPLTARTRYGVLVCGLFKFAIPAVTLTFKSPIVLPIRVLNGTMPLGPLMPAPVSHWPLVLQIAWIAPAAAIATAWLIAHRRMVASALKGSRPASPREQNALASVRRQLHLRRSVEVVRSSVCEAPAVVRVIRPIIILPDGGCDSLDDGELESLLRHECAHVARADNAIALAEAAIIATFWFHPLLWIAQRAIASAREQACDEAAAGTPEAIDTYMSALSKICRAILAPRLAGVSCMASAHLEERLDHLMRYQSLRNRALSHRIVLAFSALLVVGATLGSGLKAIESSSKTTPFTLYADARPSDEPKTLTFVGNIVEVATGRSFANPEVKFPRGVPASMRTSTSDGVNKLDFQVEIHDAGDTVTATMSVFKNGTLLQESNYETIIGKPRNYTGKPISLNLHDADVKDVLRMFGQLTGTKINYSETLQGKVTINVHDMPWDQAFEAILRMQHLSWKMEGDTITIRQSQ